MTKIEWTEKTWNPIIGCTKISEGCKNCYAERMAVRLANIPETSYYQAVTCAHAHAEPRAWNGITYFVESALEKPLKWKKPSMIFVCSMSDLFHEYTDFETILKVWDVMCQTPRHTYQVLTKRPRRMLEFLRWLGNKCKDDGLDSIPTQSDNPLDYITVPDHIWVGVTAENQEQADKRTPLLLQIPAKVRFVSAEPMLGKVDLTKYLQYESKKSGINNISIDSKQGIGNRSIWADLENSTEGMVSMGKQGCDTTMYTKKSRSQITNGISSGEGFDKWDKNSCVRSQAYMVSSSRNNTNGDDYKSHERNERRQSTSEFGVNDSQGKQYSRGQNIEKRESSQSKRTKKQSIEIGSESNITHQINGSRDTKGSEASRENNNEFSERVPGMLRHDLESSERDFVSISQIICGPETGPGARQMKREWMESLYNQCKEANVPFFDKKNVLGLNIQEYPKL
jgi:protein gp37